MTTSCTVDFGSPGFTGDLPYALALGFFAAILASWSTFDQFNFAAKGARAHHLSRDYRLVAATEEY